METITASRVTPLRDTDPELIRTPPYNTEAEQALLGALLINNMAYPRVSEFLQPEHFGNAVHARIYRRDRQADRARADRQPGHPEKPVRPGWRAAGDRRRAISRPARRRRGDHHQRRGLRARDPRPLPAAPADRAGRGRGQRRLPPRSRRPRGRADRAGGEKAVRSRHRWASRRRLSRLQRGADQRDQYGRGGIQAQRQDRRRRHRLCRSRPESSAGCIHPTW